MKLGRSTVPKLVLTILLLELMAGLIWGGVWALSSIWRKTVQIEPFTDNTDGSLAKFLQQSVEMTLRAAQQINRQADLSAISPASSFEIPFLKPESSTLKKIQELDIKVRDVSLNTFLKTMELFRHPTYVVTANTLSDKLSLAAAMELTGGSDASTSIVVSVPRTADLEADKLKLANEVGYRLLYEIAQRFKDKDTVASAGSWRSLEVYTEGLKALQDYRNATRFGDSIGNKPPQDYLDVAIAKFEDVDRIDPSFDYGTYYLAISYFEGRNKEKQAIEFLKRLLAKDPAPSMMLEARFYLGYSYFRTYDTAGYEAAVKVYDKLVKDLEQALETGENAEERVKLIGLLAESYAQLATTHAHMVAPDPPGSDTPEGKAKELQQKEEHHREFVNKSRKTEDILSMHGKDLTQELRNDIAWRRENARGIAASRLAFFERANTDEYTRHKNEALDQYKKALSYSPRNFSILENLGSTLGDPKYHDHSFKQAERFFLEAIQLKPNDDYAYSELARLYLAWEHESGNSTERTKYHQLAIDAFAKAAKLEDTERPYSRNKLVEMSSNGDQQAEKALKRARIR